MDPIKDYINVPENEKDNPHFWTECIEWLKEGRPGFEGNTISDSTWRNTLRPSTLESYNHTCAWCGWKASSHMGCDHVMTRKEGGGNAPHNLQILCRSCNSRKQAVSLPRLAPWPFPITNDLPMVYNSRRNELSEICREMRKNLKGLEFSLGEK